MKIAVIGSGIAGNAAAWALSRKHNVTVYEKQNRLGGHSATVDFEADGIRLPVDTGFIVYNEQNYPLLTKLLAFLDVETKPSEMTFSVSLDDGRLEWCGSKLRGVFAQPSNLLSPSFLRMLRDIFVFNKRANRDLRSGALCGLSFDDYLHKAGYSKRLKSDYLVPMTSAIWSTPARKMLEFPAESLVRFMDNHSLMQKKRPKWRTVSGGSRKYVAALVADTKADYKINRAVVSVERVGKYVIVEDDTGHRERFDQVVVASHSDQAIGMMKNPSKAESEILGSITYTQNDVWLHQDRKLMPKRQNAWASWNYIGKQNLEDEREVSVTYWMNKLQNIRKDYPLFVTLNPITQPREELTVKKFQYSHPLFDGPAVAAQKRLHEIQGTDRIWYCGAWTAYGFHEDGLRSGLQVAEALGASPPWDNKLNSESYLSNQAPDATPVMAGAAE
ncbi:MAG: FAD-dependent oxidoreductase [Pseudomonadota bacterium]